MPCWNLDQRVVMKNVVCQQFFPPCLVGSQQCCSAHHYKMKRHRRQPVCVFLGCGLCHSPATAVRSVSFQFVAVLCQSDTMWRHTVFWCVAQLMFFANDRLVLWRQITINAITSPKTQGIPRMSFAVSDWLPFC